MSTNIIGISAHYHDSACCLIQDGVLKAAVQEERFTRKKNDPDLPKKAFMYCLKEGGIGMADIDCIAYYEDSRKKLSRQLWSGIQGLTSQQIMDIQPLRVEESIRKDLGFNGLIKVYEHHQSHAASSFFYSDFKESAILTVDGVGEWATTSYGTGKDAALEIFEEVEFPNSIGLLYSTLTSFLGFSVNSGEYKVMGLAPYGRPVFADKIWQMIRLTEKGQYELDMQYYNFLKGERMYSDLLAQLLGIPPRRKDTDILAVHKDIAKSLQVVLEEILISKAQYLHDVTGSENLCMAGGVALNCVANGKILKHTSFKNMFVQPAAGDAGCSLGAAALAYADITGKRIAKTENHVYLGPSYSNDSIRKVLQSTSLVFSDFESREDELLQHIAQKIADGKVIGWFHGRMEFGPRSLGARSILADPRGAQMRDRINAMVKKREAFRPFAPAILSEETSKHFDLDHDSPFMLETCDVISHLDLPAITHVDRSARVQTVHKETNPRFYKLLQAFQKITGCPILLNTSFNIKDEPIICSPEEAVVCFVTTDIDCLVVEDFFIDAEGNDLSLLEMINQNLVRAVEFELNPDVYTFI